MVNLHAPLSWTNASPSELRMLTSLQGNILKGHGRSHTEHIFLSFKQGAATDVRAFLRSLAPAITPALEQLQDAEKHASFKDGSPERASIDSKIFMSVAISAAGYEALGIEELARPNDQAFRQGLKSRSEQLEDPAPLLWEQHFRQDIHAMILLAGPSPSVLQTHRQQLLSHLPQAVTVAGIEVGLAMHNTDNHGIEHFGYVDGRSQPLLLTEDIAKERATTGTAQWDPAFPLKQALVRCPGGDSDTAFGSYLVFRKLDQNVADFKERESALSNALGLKDPKRAGAMVVGRFEDGTPLVLQATDGLPGVPNDFNYGGDPSGMKCPFQAHIRKTNPRGETGAAAEREHIMPRRGIPYGERDARRDSDGRIVEFNDAPTGGVGLLFMAYQSDIIRQFEFTQAAWSNNRNFVKPNTGLDPLTGQGTTTDQKWPLVWDQPETQPFSFAGFVTLKGGEYFFAPCITFFHNL
jgi:Dyp-type peroxidase family